MSLQKLMTNYANYNVWANKTLIEWLNTKPTEVFHKEVLSSFPSILKTLNHIWAVEEFWHSVIAETTLETNRYGAAEIELGEVLSGLVERSELLATYVRALSEKDLEKEVFLDTPWVKGTMPRYEFIQHCLNHSTYHRGQITTMGHHADLHDAPMTDYNYYNMMTRGDAVAA
jgi:uncharacterized damage-inducible protein DinB